MSAALMQMHMPCLLSLPEEDSQVAQNLATMTKQPVAGLLQATKAAALLFVILSEPDQRQTL
jgi:hypothetical protein